MNKLMLKIKHIFNCKEERSGPRKGEIFIL